MEKDEFVKSLTNDIHSGVIDISRIGTFDYVLENGIVVWTAKSDSQPNEFNSRIQASTGSLDINAFYAEYYSKHPDEAPKGFDVKCPLCVHAVRVLIVETVACLTFTQVCSHRCASNCVAGPKKCSTSCLSQTCDIECNANPNGPILSTPWTFWTDWIILDQINYDSGNYVTDPN